MDKTAGDAWRQISPYLDQVLDLEPEARVAWLDALEQCEPAMAAQLRMYLAELAKLDRQDFLVGPAGTLLAPSSLASQRFGAYTLDREIGHGGMGTVWLAHRSDGSFEGQAAVKVLNAARLGHHSEQRIAREGSVLAKLQHPNIAHLLDAGVSAHGQPYLILQYVLGTRIDRYCQTHELRVEQRIKLFLDVLAAVAHAHSNLIVHRDLKPSNILVTDDGVVKLLDFGVAALLPPDAASLPRPTDDIAVGMTPGYAAPEQLRGEGVTTATDVYSLGLLLFELLVGMHPAAPEGKSATELMRGRLDNDAPRPSSVTDNIRLARLLRGDLDHIIAMALRRNPAERYTTVDLFAQDLRSYLALEPVAARPRSLRYVAARFVQRHRGAVAVAVAIVTLLIVVVVTTTAQMLEARRERDEARFQSRRAESSDEFLKLLMLSDFGPNQAAATLHERLELGVRLLDKQYADDPKFAGRMLVGLAAYFNESQELQRADELYTRAYEMGRRNHDMELMASAQCNRIPGDAGADIREGTVERMQEAQRLLHEVRDPSAALQVACIVAQASIERTLRHPATAETLLRQALSVLDDSGSNRPDTYISILGDLGQVYLDRHQPREALQILQRAGDMLEHLGRGGTVARLIVRQNAAIALSSMGEVGASLAEREIINQRARAIASSEHELLVYRINYAVFLTRMAKPKEAIAVLDGVLAGARRSGHRAMIAHALLANGTLFVQVRQFAEADKALQEAEGLVAGGMGDKNTAGQIESITALLELARGNLQAAHQHSQKSLELIGYYTHAPESLSVRVLLVAAKVSLGVGETAEAERFASDALATAEVVARGPNTSSDVGEALLRLAQARFTAGRTAETEAMLERAVQCLTNGLAPDHPLTNEARALLAHVTA